MKFYRILFTVFILLFVCVNLQAGEFRIYTTRKLEAPEMDLLSDLPTNKEIIAGQFELSQNYPNPFNPQTTIKYQIPTANSVELVVLNVLGQKIQTLVRERQMTGNYEVKLNATDLASGVYFYRLKAGGFTQIKKMLLVR